MISTVTLNPSLDEHITVNGLMVEESNRWAKLHRYAGGKGIDVSRAIHEMGGITTAYGFIGGNIGRVVEILLDKEGVLFSFTPIKNDTRTNFIITDSKTNQQTRIGAPGPNVSKKELERLFQKLRKIRPSPKMLVVGGSVPPRISDSVYADIISECHTYNVKCILDSEGIWLEEGIKSKPYLIKPNVHEAEMLLKKELPTEQEIVQAAIDFVEMGIEIATISMGKDGIIAATKDNIFKVIPPTVKVRSAVGAGDCTVAGLALKLAYGEPLIDACRQAVAMGTACVMTPGTALCHRADVAKILPKVKVANIPRPHRAKVFSASTN